MAVLDSIPPTVPLTSYPNIRDLSGKTFDRLSVLGFLGKSGRQRLWLCRCVCGNHTSVDGARLTGDIDL